MRVFYDLVNTTENTAVALGYFDGVHLGHKKVIDLAVQCKEQGLTPVVFTFSNTPKKGDELLQLLTVEQRALKLKELGVEILYIVDFDDVKNLTPEEFVEKVVKNVFNAKKVFCGFNYHFGKNGAGNCEDLKNLCNKHGIQAEVTEPVVVGDEIISSTLIRKLLKQGDIKKANQLLGYDFGYNSIAVTGNRIGTKMGTPTINQVIPANAVLPQYGVYASKVTLEGKIYTGVTNIGVKPTISGGNAPLCETWLPEYKGGELYGKMIDVRIKEFIRPERKFKSLDELKSAIFKDAEIALNIL